MPALLDLVAEATVTYPLPVVEAALVTAWCARHQLVPDPAGAVGRTVAAGAPQPLCDVLAAATSWDLDDLVMSFETLVPEAEARQYGAVFTPEAITAFMAREACDRAVAAGADLRTATVIDPAVGCGALLVATLRELVARTGEPAARVADRMSGVDVSADSLRRTRLLLELACLALGDPTVPAPRLLAADALTADLPAAAFTIVIGNPPYVRYQRLPAEQRAALAQRWQVCGPGNFNLYFPFFELCGDLVSADGVIALITPNGYFTSLSGAPVRTWLAARRLLDDVVDFGHHRVFRAMTYTAIAFGSPKLPGDAHPGFGYADVSGLDDLAALPADWATSRTSPIGWDRLSGRPWRLVGPSHRAAVETIAATGTPLAECATVRFGVATCRDKLYLLDGGRDAAGNYVKTHAGVTYLIEPGLTRRCVKVSGVATAEELADLGTRIIYPYELTETGAVVLDEETLAARYPGGYAYLQAIRGELAGRDNGRKTYAAWYAYARTQGLVPSGPRLLTPLYAGRPRFLTDPDTEGLFVNGCAVTPGAGTDAETLAWVLNSGVCHFYVEATANAISNGFFAYQKSQLAGFGIPTLTDADRARLRAAGGDGERDDILADIYQITLPAPYRRAD